MQDSSQIYQEAVLEPFTETQIYYKFCPNGDPCALRKFVDALAPPEVKAITCLRLAIEHDYIFKNNDVLPSLIFGAIPGKGPTYSSDIATDIGSLPAMQSLVELRLRILRITVEAEFADGDDGWIKFPTFSSKGETSKIEKWLRDLELRPVVGTMVAIYREPWPSFAIRQDDDKVPIPPWSTDEGLTKGRAEKERRYG